MHKGDIYSFFLSNRKNIKTFLEKSLRKKANLCLSDVLYIFILKISPSFQDSGNPNIMYLTLL